MFPIPRGPLGRWFWARNELMHPLAMLIQQRRLPLPPDSPLAKEREWILAQRIMQITRKPHGTAIPLADLRDAVNSLMEHVDRTAHSTWAGGGMQIDSHDIRWIRGQLQRASGEYLSPPWPSPDQLGLQKRWRWQGYSSELSHAVMTDVLHAAVIGYRDLVSENFAAFGWALGLNSALPVEVEGALAIPEDDKDGEYTMLNYRMKPSRAGGHEAVSHIHLDLLTQPGSGWRGARGFGSTRGARRSPFYLSASYNTPPLTGQSRPATNLAYQWLATDLRAVGWLKGAAAFYD